MDYPISVPNVNLVDGKFIDQAEGQIGSLFPAEWPNAVTEEIRNVLIQAGITPNEAVTTQLKTAILALIATNAASLSAANTFTKAQRGAVVDVTSAVTAGTAIDFSVANNFTMTLSANTTLAVPTNLVAGQSGSIVIVQDSTGTHTLAFPTVFKFEGGIAPTVGNAASAVSLMGYFVKSATEIECVMRTSFA